MTKGTKIMRTLNIEQLTLALALVFLLAAPVGVFAETIIKNSVSATANSGGNTAEAGEVVEGEARGSVFIKTIVDGEVVEEIDEEISGQGSFRASTTHTLPNGEVRSEALIETSGTASTPTGPREESASEADGEDDDEGAANPALGQVTDASGQEQISRVRVFADVFNISSFISNLLKHVFALFNF